METINLGRVAFVYKGDYSALTTYNKMDVVFDGESSFVSQIDNNVGNELVNGLKWKYLSRGNNLELQEAKQDIVALETDLNDSELRLNSVIGNNYSTEFSEVGKTIQCTANVGSVVQLTPSTLLNWQYLIASVQEGDVLDITLRGGTNSPAYFIVDANSVLLYKNAVVTPQTVRITIPANASKIIFNNDTLRVQAPSIVQIGSIDGLFDEVDYKILNVENRFIVSDSLSEYASLNPGYFANWNSTGITTLALSSSWSSWVIPVGEYKKIIANLATSTNSYVSIMFLSSSVIAIENIINFVPFHISSNVYESEIPEGTHTILLCNRNANLANPTALLYKELSMQSVYETQKEVEEIKMSIPKFCVGSLRLRGISSPSYTEKIGEIDNVFSHFKMAMVKDGVVQYYLNPTNILFDESSSFSSALDGTDGDVLIVNDRPIYYLIYGNDTYDLKLFSLIPFSYDSTICSVLEPKGFAPSLCFIDNINETTSGDRYANLLTGKTHYVRNVNNIAHITPMQGMVGKYVPSESGGIISYLYDSTKKFAENGIYRPSVWLTQRTAEKAAINKNTQSASYTNSDILSREILISLVQSELATKYISSQNYFGSPYSSPGITVTESIFTSGVLAINGCRFKDSNGVWVYNQINAKPFNNDKFLFEMLTDWMSPWEIMEQHLVLSFAKTNSIATNTWFVYNENEYKYVNVGTAKGIQDGVMTAVLFKKFRSKLDSLTYNSTNVSGNDIEFVIFSSIYRGFVMDTSPHIWLTGINCVLNGDFPSTYYFYVEHDYRRYIMDKDYSPISSNELYDFEKIYKLASAQYKAGSSLIYAKDFADKCLMLPKVQGDSANNYERMYIETDMKQANATSYPTASTVAESGVKIVTGVKNGYGGYSIAYLNYLYLWHPRTYFVAKAGYSSFVCQNVIP